MLAESLYLNLGFKICSSFLIIIHQLSELDKRMAESQKRNSILIFVIY